MLHSVQHDRNVHQHVSPSHPGSDIASTLVILRPTSLSPLVILSPTQSGEESILWMLHSVQHDRNVHQHVSLGHPGSNIASTIVILRPTQSGEESIRFVLSYDYSTDNIMEPPPPSP